MSARLLKAVRLSRLQILITSIAETRICQFEKNEEIDSKALFGHPSSRPAVSVCVGRRVLRRPGTEASDPDWISLTAACYRGTLQSVRIFAIRRSFAAGCAAASFTCSADAPDGRVRG